jgi:lysophospholipase L1-like esterase
MSSPLFAGDAGIATRWLSGSPTVLWIGDSIGTALQRRVFEGLRVTPAGFLVSGGSYSAIGGLTFATLGAGGLGASGLLSESNYSPFGSSEAVFNGVAVPTTGGAAASNSRMFSDATEVLFTAGRTDCAFGDVDWLAGQSGLQLRVVMYRNSVSANGIVRNYVRGSSSSSTFKGHGNWLNLSASSASYLLDAVSFAAPAVGEDIYVELQSFDGAAPTNGSNCVICCAVVATGAGGFTLLPANIDSWDILKWLDTSRISDASPGGVLSLLGITDVVISLGLNNTASQTADQFQTSLEQLVTRLRLAMPAASIVFLPEYDANNPGTSNAPQLAGFADAYYAVQKVTTNSCFLNLYQAAGPWAQNNALGYFSDGVHANDVGAIYFVQTIGSLLQQLIGGLANAAAGRYAVQGDVEDLFGAVNVAQWSSQSNSGTTFNVPRIQRALNYADAAIDDFFRGGPYAVPLCPIASAPTVTRWAAVLAGAWLFQASATVGSDGATASLTIPAGASFSAAVSSSSTPYSSLVTEVYAEMGQVKAGVVEIDSAMAGTGMMGAPAISE